MVPFIINLLHPLLFCTDARALEKHRGRCSGVRTCPAESALLENERENNLPVNKRTHFAGLVMLIEGGSCLCVHK